MPKNLKRNISNLKKSINTKSLGKRAKKACEVTTKYNIFNGGVCTKCIYNMPNKIADIKYLTDVELVDKLENACKNDKLHAYCNACKNTLIVQKSNIGLFSSKEFEKLL